MKEILLLIEPITHGLGVSISNFISNYGLKIKTIVFLGSVASFIFLPFIFFFGTPELPQNIWQYFLIGLLGFGNFFYIFPYMLAHKNMDSSSISALFSFGKIFVPIFSYLILGEVLNIESYVGFGMIITATLILSYENKKKFKFSSAVILMFGVSLIFSLQSVLYKYLLQDLHWVDIFFFTSLVYCILGFSMIVYSSVIKEVYSLYKNNKSFNLIFIFHEFLDWLGDVGQLLALNYFSPTIVKGVTSLQPFFTMFFSSFLQKRFSIKIIESLNMHDIFKKFFSFILILVGTLLLL